jgi:hypothetical protein
MSSGLSCKLVLTLCMLTLVSGRSGAGQICDIAVINFQGDHSVLLNPRRVIRNSQGGLAAAIQDFEQAGKSHVLYTGSKPINGTNSARFTTNEQAKFVVSGETGELPELPKIELKLTVQSVPQMGSLKVSFSGTIRWCPDLFKSGFAVEQTRAKQINQTRKVIQVEQSSTGYSANQFVQLAMTNSAGSGVYQLPIIREAQFDSSRTCKANEVIVNFTVAESGVASPEALVLLVLLREEP